MNISLGNRAARVIAGAFEINEWLAGDRPKNITPSQYIKPSDFGVTI